MPGMEGEPRPLISELIDVDGLTQNELEALPRSLLHRSLRRLLSERDEWAGDFLWFDNVNTGNPGFDRRDRRPAEEAGTAEMGEGGMDDDGRPERR
ncbi:hypothetical protein ACN26Z_06450 [Verrucosispora sp. WMMD703]|uniref:hypothetical protein n=1 Tax=Verrucosispora sp. WMMD703 TaxID=3403463 RepID=UPI003B938968